MFYIINDLVNIKGLFCLTSNYYPLMPSYGKIQSINLFSTYQYTILTSVGIILCMYDQISLPKALTVDKDNPIHLNRLHHTNINNS